MKEEYFNQGSGVLKNQESLQKAFRDASGSQLSIRNQLIEGQLFVQNMPRQLHPNFKKQVKQTQEEEKSTRLRDIKMEKYQLKRKLKVLKHEEMVFPRHIKLQPIQKPQQSQQVGKISSLVRNFKKFQKQLEEKTTEYEQQLERAKRQMNQQQFKIKELSKNERLKISKQNISIIKKREEIRKQQHQTSIKQMSVIKHKKPLFQKMNERWKSMEESEREQMISLKEEIKKSKMINLSNMSDHEQKYDNILQLKRIQREQKKEERRTINSMHLYSPFYQQIRQQQIEKLRTTQQRQHLPKIKRDRIKQYGEFVRQNLQPKTSDQKEQRSEFEETRMLKALSTNELHAKGNEYMKRIHQNLDKTKFANHPVQKSIEKPHNYLKDLASKRHKKPQLYKKSNSQVIHSMIANQNIRSPQVVQKIYQAIETVEKNSSKKKTESDSLFQAMQFKLNVLQKYYELQNDNH